MCILFTYVCRMYVCVCVCVNMLPSARRINNGDEYKLNFMLRSVVIHGLLCTCGVFQFFGLFNASL